MPYSSIRRRQDYITVFHVYDRLKNINLIYPSRACNYRHCVFPLDKAQQELSSDSVQASKRNTGPGGVAGLALKEHICHVRLQQTYRPNMLTGKRVDRAPTPSMGRGGGRG